MYTATPTHGLNYWLAPITLRHEITPYDIIAAGCWAFGITKEELLSKSHKRDFVRARYICMFIVRQRTDLGLIQIGKFFNRDHTSILHGIRRIENDLSVTAYRQRTNEEINKVLSLL